MNGLFTRWRRAAWGASGASLLLLLGGCGSEGGSSSSEAMGPQGTPNTDVGAPPGATPGGTGRQQNPTTATPTNTNNNTGAATPSNPGSTPSGQASAGTGGGTTPAMGDGDSMADPMAGGSDMGEEMPAEGEEDSSDECEVRLDECPNLDSGWPGDEYCIQPPPEDEGFQLHVGPDSYENPDDRYLTPPGADTNRYFDAVSGNDEQIYYYYREYRMRPGSHHMIINAASSAGGSFGGIGGDLGGGRRLGGSSNSAKDNPECGVIAPENEGVGMPLDPNTPISVNLHYFNTSDEPALQEIWVNFWYRDPSKVEEETKEMFSMGGLAMAIQPGENTTLGPYSCPVDQAGRMLTMYGHYHANTVRFSAWRERNGERELILEDYDWHDPLILEYNSITENPEPNPDLAIAGGHSGILDLKPGDELIWECEVHNETDGVLRFSNEAVTGEMCILIGDTVGPQVSCQHP